MQGTKADLAELVGLVADGALDPVVDSTYLLSDAAAADERLDSDTMFGRIVLRVDEHD